MLDLCFALEKLCNVSHTISMISVCCSDQQSVLKTIISFWVIKSRQLYHYLFDICCNVFILQRLLLTQNVFCEGKASSKYFERIQIEPLGFILDPYFTQTYPFSQLIQVNQRCGFVIFYWKLGLIIHVE